VAIGVYWGCVFIWVFFVSSSLFLFLFFFFFFFFLPSRFFLFPLCYHSNLAPDIVTRFPLVSAWLIEESDFKSCQPQDVSTYILHSVQDRL
jgi:hypothetical protein